MKLGDYIADVMIDRRTVSVFSSLYINEDVYYNSGEYWDYCVSMSRNRSLVQACKI